MSNYTLHVAHFYEFIPMVTVQWFDEIVSFMSSSFVDVFSILSSSAFFFSVCLHHRTKVISTLNIYPVSRIISIRQNEINKVGIVFVFGGFSFTLFSYCVERFSFAMRMGSLYNLVLKVFW